MIAAIRATTRTASQDQLNSTTKRSSIVPPSDVVFLPIIKTMTPIMTSMIHDDGMMRMTMTKAARMIMMIIIVIMVAMMNGDTGDVVVDGSDDEDGDGDVVHAVCWSSLR